MAEITGALNELGEKTDESPKRSSNYDYGSR